MSREKWPDVNVDEYGQITCPVTQCGAPIYLERSYCIPLIAEQAASGDHDPDAAITDRWQVACQDGHVLHTCRDQLRAMPDADETADYAPEYDHFLLHKRINALGATE